MAVLGVSLVRRLLCGHFCDWKWTWIAGDGGEPVSCRYVFLWGSIVANWKRC